MLLFLLTPCLAVAVQLCVVHSVGQLISVVCWGKNWPAISNIFLSIVDMISKEIWHGGLALYVTYRRSIYRSDLFFNYLGRRLGCKQLGKLNVKKGPEVVDTMCYLLKYQRCNIFEVKSVTEKSHKQTLVSSSITLSVSSVTHNVTLCFFLPAEL